ncbi:DNA-binding protein [Alicycliphilus denitrificans]|uniref:DNA-binding protein n=1 Tax=Alicycliphilus denitrificans TaxID=179636 RepID=A0A858ZU63_9BURK|nr:DNA-binding protein [Alicycliphilus denitrificans]QKD44480.1 DNA-binding protein [Alicycliphilus denitrificans]
MHIEEALTGQYGPLLSMAQLAKVLDRSAEGLRVSLRNDTEWARQLNAAKMKLGRRVYFRTAEIAKFLGGA